MGINKLPRVRVLIVTHMWPSESRPEHGSFVRDQVEALRALDGIDVEVAIFPPGAGSYLRAARELGRSGRGRGFDVVHAHYGLSGWSALAVRGAPHVVTFHGTDLAHRWVGPLSRALLRLVDLPAAVSASLVRARARRTLGRRTIAVLPCGVDLDRFKRIERAEARRRLGLDRERTYLLFPADPARPAKRHDRAHALAARLPGELLVLRGIPPADVPLWVNAANAVLVTSDHEGFGLAALEALACDVPVLSTPVGIAPLALAGVDGALCAPFEEERWLAALAGHAADPDPRVAGRTRAALFSTERMASRVRAAYAEVVSAGQKRP